MHLNAYVAQDYIKKSFSMLGNNLETQLRAGKYQIHGGKLLLLCKVYRPNRNKGSIQLPYFRIQHKIK